MLLSELSWPQVNLLDRDIPVVVPIAAMEQHGHHLPLFTDSLLLGEVVDRVHEAMGNAILVTPLMWLGNSDHHLDFPGTLSASPRVYLDLLCGLIENLIQHGFRRIVLFNGHGGNEVPGKQAVFEIRQLYRDRDDLLLLFATYWQLGTTVRDFQTKQQEMGHACEWETSMMLCIRPDLVGEFQQVVPQSPGNAFRPAYRGWITKDRSHAGHIGEPDAASNEKGDALLEAFTEDAVALLQRVIAWDGSSWNG